MTSSQLVTITRRRWDYLIVGTGMGGATVGYALAAAGKAVLFVEAGRSYLWQPEALRGDFAETFSCSPHAPPCDEANLLQRAGRWAEPITDLSGTVPKSHTPFLGSGSGGSSALYGMALERFAPGDFTPRANFAQLADSTIPDAWPLTYEELRPYYDAAEHLFRVRGERDPLRKHAADPPLLPPPPLGPTGQELFGLFTSKGLHPYRLPLACERLPGCRCCQGYLCPQDCKNDAARSCLRPAVEQHGAVLLDQCEVVRLEANRHHVTGVACRWQGQEVMLRADTVILAAGALKTPQLLLQSTSTDWPTGLANRSGLVGRNLMRHYVDLYLVRTQAPPGPDAGLKELAFNDLYSVHGQKFGTVQSFGSLPPVPILLTEQERTLRANRRRISARVFRWAKPLIRPIFQRMLSRRVILASIMEDLPFSDNRVTIGTQAGRPRLQLEYRLREVERRRIAAFRSLVAQALHPYRFSLIKQAENNERLAHVCGTCRFGESPHDSVLTPNNRAHEIDNLYVADASCFPSSGGTNPGLTIAALALRLAEHLIGAKPLLTARFLPTETRL